MERWVLSVLVAVSLVGCASRGRPQTAWMRTTTIVTVDGSVAPPFRSADAMQRWDTVGGSVATLPAFLPCAGFADPSRREHALTLRLPVENGAVAITIHAGFSGQGHYEFTSDRIGDGKDVEFVGFGDGTRSASDARDYFAPTVASVLTLDVAADASGAFKITELEHLGVKASAKAAWTCLDKGPMSEAEMRRELHGNW